ncbi:hypothetical protein [Magnetospira thiophila]
MLLEIVLVVFFVTHRGWAFGSHFLGQGLPLLLLLLLFQALFLAHLYALPGGFLLGGLFVLVHLPDRLRVGLGLFEKVFLLRPVARGLVKEGVRPACRGVEDGVRGNGRNRGRGQGVQESVRFQASLYETCPHPGGCPSVIIALHDAHHYPLD